MSVTAAGSMEGHRGLSSLWNRQLDTYPDTTPRVMYLGITVLSTIVLYYQLYVGGSVSTLFLQKLHMSFTFFVYTLAIGNLIGAFGSLFAGLTDRLGRTNIVVIGLFVTGIFVGVHHSGLEQQVGVHHLRVRGGFRRRNLPGSDARIDPGLLPAGRASHCHGLLDQWTGRRKPGRLHCGQPHHRRQPQSIVLDPRVPH